MGGCDVTCAVSHLPILEKDPCRFIFLREREFESDSYHGDIWHPMTLPVKGVYDWYGSVEKVEDTPLVRFQVEALQRIALPLPEDEYRDGWPRMENFPHSIESWMFLCERDLLKVRYKTILDTEPVMDTVPYIVREEVYQAMIQEPGKGVGISRSRVESYAGDSTGGLRLDVEHTKRRLKTMSMPADVRGMMEEGLGLLDRVGPSMTRREIEFLFCGARVNPGDFKSLLEFTEEDWVQLNAEVLDFLTFQATLAECRREFMPAHYKDQADMREDPTIANEILASLIANVWGPAIREKHEDLEEDDE